MATAASLPIAVVTIIGDNFPCLAPFEVVRVKQRIDQNNDVHEWRREKVKEEPNEVL